MIIDFHQHLSINDDLDKRLALLKRNNIEQALVMPYDFPGFDLIDIYVIAKKKYKPKRYIKKVLQKLDRINDELKDFVKNEDDLFFVPWISPECDNLDSIINESPIIKFIPILDEFTSDYFERIKPMIKPGKCVMIHTGWGVEPEEVTHLSVWFPETTFIIAHMKEDNNYHAIQRLRALEIGIYCETSYYPHNKRLSQYIKAGHGDQLLFGSDLRDEEDEQTLRGWLKQLEVLEASDSDKKAMVYGNARDLMANI